MRRLLVCTFVVLVGAVWPANAGIMMEQGFGGGVGTYTGGNTGGGSGPSGASLDFSQATNSQYLL